jgi:hypothetical protein
LAKAQPRAGMVDDDHQDASWQLAKCHITMKNSWLSCNTLFTRTHTLLLRSNAERVTRFFQVAGTWTHDRGPRLPAFLCQQTLHKHSNYNKCFIILPRKLSS